MVEEIGYSSILSIMSVLRISTIAIIKTKINCSMSSIMQIVLRGDSLH